MNIVASGLQTCVGFGGFVLAVAGNVCKEFKAIYMLQQVLIALRIRCRNSVIIELQIKTKTLLTENIVLAMLLFWSVV